MQQFLTNCSDSLTHVKSCLSLLHFFKMISTDLVALLLLAIKSCKFFFWAPLFSNAYFPSIWSKSLYSFFSAVSSLDSFLYLCNVDLAHLWCVTVLACEVQLLYTLPQLHTNILRNIETLDLQLLHHIFLSLSNDLADTSYCLALAQHVSIVHKSFLMLYI